MIFLILPLIAALLAQCSKFFIKSNKTRFSFRNIVAYSGMPSGHAAMTVSLTTIIALELGLNSPMFGLAAIVMILTIRDAVGLRRYLGQQGAVINELVQDLDEDKFLDDKYPHLREAIGHSLAQIAVGALIGFFVSLIGFYLWK